MIRELPLGIFDSQEKCIIISEITPIYRPIIDSLNFKSRNHPPFPII